MTTTLLTTQQMDRTRLLLQKLEAISPEKRQIALMMCNFFIDGMTTQEQIAEQARDGERRDGA